MGPTASVVAKAGFRSCSPCCRDMLALARPTGKTFIMVDLAENDNRGTFHFVTGSRYLPVPKEACSAEEVAALKKIVADAQDARFTSSNAIYEAVLDVGAPIDEVAQTMYLGDAALLPEGCAGRLRGQALLDVLHAEHFARLPAEYGASILRDATRPLEQQKAVHRCRARAKDMLIAAWAPHLKGLDVDMEAYASAAVAPLLPEDPNTYVKLRTSRMRPSAKQASSRSADRRWGVDGSKDGRVAHARLTAARLLAIDENAGGAMSVPGRSVGGYVKISESKPLDVDDGASTAVASTAMPDDGSSLLSCEDECLDFEDPDEEEESACRRV